MAENGVGETFSLVMFSLRNFWIELMVTDYPWNPTDEIIENRHGVVQFLGGISRKRLIVYVDIIMILMTEVRMMKNELL